MRRMLMLLMVVFAVMPAFAQEGTIAAGTRVRVTMVADDVAQGFRIVVGRLLSADDSALLVTPLGSTAVDVIPRSRLAKLEVRTGPDRAAGARLGALVGGVMGGALGLAAGEDCTSTDWICFDRSETTFAGILLGGSLGALIGVMAGRGDRFRETPPPARLGLVPLRTGGVHVALAVPFGR